MADTNLLIGQAALALGVPVQDREGVAANIGRKLWKPSEESDPNGSAKWNTYTASVAGVLCEAWLSKLAAGARCGVISAGECDDRRLGHAG